MILSEKNIRLGMAFLFGCIITMNMTLLTNNDDVATDYGTRSTTTKSSALRSFQSTPNHRDGNNNNNNNNNIHPTNKSNNNENLLQGIRILVAITAFDFSQIPHLEEVVDSYLDLCIVSGIQKLDLVIYTTVAYSVTLIDLWNTRIPTSCKHNNLFSLTIIVKPYKMRLFLVDCHRYLFYEKLKEYDLFIYTEDDMVVHPKTIAAYLEETQRLQQLVGLEKSVNYNVGIVRYEYNFPSNVVMDDNTRHSTQNVTRVYWEHFTKPMFTFNSTKKSAAARPIPNTPELSHTHIHMTNHHQGMYLVTQYLLQAWAQPERGPHCEFSRVRKHPKTPTQRVWMSSFMMYGYPHSTKGTIKGACHIQQVLPIDTFGSLTVYHLPNKNHRRVKTRLTQNFEFTRPTGDEPDFDFGDTQNKLVSAMKFHIEISKQHHKQHDHNKIQPSQQDDIQSTIPYTGIRMIDQRHSGSGDGSSGIEEEQGGDAPEDMMTIDNDRFRDYHAYVARGGIMSLQDMTHTDLMEGDALVRQTTLKLKNQKSNKAKLEAKETALKYPQQAPVVKHQKAALRLEKKAKAKAKADAAVLNFDSRRIAAVVETPIPEETVTPTEGADDDTAAAEKKKKEGKYISKIEILNRRGTQRKNRKEQQLTEGVLTRKNQRNNIGTQAEICDWYGLDCGDFDPQEEQEQHEVIETEQHHDYDRNRNPLYYELWNHTTDTITIPNALRPDYYTSNSDDHNNNNKQKKYTPTSLEILQSVLHGEENEHEYVAVEEHVRTNLSDTSIGSFRTSLPLPQCLLPNKVATRKLADDMMLIQSQHDNNTVITKTLLPVLNVGFAKFGTSTLADFFLCAGYYTTHDKVGNKYLSKEANQQYTWKNNKGPMMGDLHEGIELTKRAKKNAQHNYQNNNKSDTSTSTHHTSLLDYHKQYTTPENKPIEAHCQLDTSRVEGFYPQVKLLDELHADQPNSTFVLLFRPIHDWLNSINHWAGIKDRMSRFEMPGLLLSATQKEDIQVLRKWHIEYNAFLQLSKSSRFHYVNDYYQTLLENPIHPEDTSTNGIALSEQYTTFHEYQKKVREQTKNNVGGGAADFIPLESPVDNDNDNDIDVDHHDNNNTIIVQVKRPQQHIFPFKRPPVPEPVDDIQLTRWWCGHVKHIREFVKQYPSHKLIELDLYDTDESSTVLYDLFQQNQKRHPGNDKNDKKSCWGHANMNKKAQKVK